MRHKQLLPLKSVLQTEISDFPKPDKTNFRMWVSVLKIDLQTILHTLLLAQGTNLNFLFF